jgi:polyvinyl alcohol dehydrogenase (cytochrome)
VRVFRRLAPFLVFYFIFCCLELQAVPVSGEEVYRTRCSSCHDQVGARIPPREALQKMSRARILRTLDFGLMMSIAYPMRREEREAVASFLGTAGDETALSPGAFCPRDRTILSNPAGGNWNGWSASPFNTRYQTAEGAGLTAEQIRKLKLKWAWGFPGDVTAFAAPTVWSGTLFVGSAGGTVQALDAKSGCAYWIFQANGPVRAAPLAVPAGPGAALLFGDQIGWVYSVDARTGKLNWKQRVETHEATRLTASLATDDGVVFVPAASWEETRALDPQYACCTFRGSLTALRVRDGSVVWKTYMVGMPRKTGVTSAGTERFGPSGAGIWSKPTVDKKRSVLYVTTGDNYSYPATSTSDAVVAIELKTGRIVWSQQTTPNDVYNSSCGARGSNCPPDSGPDHDFGSSVMLAQVGAGRELLVAGQKSGIVYALDPNQKGKLIWQTRVGQGSANGGVQWGMAADGQKVYAAVSDAVRLANVAGPAPVGNANLDPMKGGGLTALYINDGTKAWFVPGQACDPPRPGGSPAQPGAVTAIPGVVLSGSLNGHIRAFATEDGQVLWDFDTVRTYDTVNGIKANGGSLDGAGPVVVNGMVFINSGYPRFGGMPGNVLLAFGPEDQN